MKIIIIIVTLFLVSISSETVKSQSFMLGGEVGVNLANINQSSSNTTDSRVGLIIGAMMEERIGKSSFTFKGGMRYISKGYKIESGDNEGDYNIGYLDIPVLFKYDFLSSEVNPFLVAGMTSGIKLFANKENSDGGYSDFSEDVFTFDGTFLFGGGIDFKLASETKLYLQFAYSLGYTNINQRLGSLTTAENVGIQITSGILFGF